MIKISEKVVVETGFPGCNPGAIVIDRKVILVDTPYLPSDALKWKKEMDFEILIPGHGEVCDKGAVDDMISYNKGIFEQVEEAVRQGLSKEETAKKVVFGDEMPLMSYHKDFGERLSRMGISHLYDEFSTPGDQ